MTQKQKQKINEKINNGDRSKINSGKFLKRLGNLNKILVCMILLIVGYFVASTNDLSIKGFVLRELQIEISDIRDQNEKLELGIMERESYAKIDKRAKELNMVKIEKIDYITITEDSFAKR